MPKHMEMKLMAIARKRGYGKKKTGAFVYKTMNKITGGMPAMKKNHK